MLAALLNALRVVGKRLEDVRIVVTGAGAPAPPTPGCCRRRRAARSSAATGRARSTPAAPGSTRSGPSSPPRRIRERCSGSADEALAGADVYIGLSGPGAVSVDGIRSMADDAIVFAMANPTPEIAPEEIEDLVAVIGTGRSDYPNQINNVLGVPGLFRGALDVRATTITEGMKIAAAPRARGRRRPRTTSRPTTSCRACSTGGSRLRSPPRSPARRSKGRRRPRAAGAGSA